MLPFIIYKISYFINEKYKEIECTSYSIDQYVSHITSLNGKIVKIQKQSYNKKSKK